MHKLLLFFILIFCLVSNSYAAPCYGTKLPEKKKLFGGVQFHSVYKRYLENQYGKVRSIQEFILLSYGVFNWLSIDLKGGMGNIRQHPVDTSEVRYSPGFAGGYGFRLKFYDRKNTKIVFAFQHISAHPKSKLVGGVKNKAVWDDWQWSLLVSHNFWKLTPYLGSRWSRIDYIHWLETSRKRRMSDLTKSSGLIFGLDLPFNEKVWLNLEGQFFDSDAASVSLNYKF